MAPDEHTGYALRVARLTALRAGRPWLRDEAESEALVALAEALEGAGRARSPRAWVGCLVKRRVLSFLRGWDRDGRRAEARARAPEDPHDPAASEGYEDLVHGLGPTEAAVLRLVFVEGHGRADALRLFGFSEGAGQRFYTRAIDRARARATA